MTSIHVSPDGSNGNDGSRSSPLTSLEAGVDQAGAGDDVVVHDGTYEFDDQFVIEQSGTTSSPLAVRAAEDASPVIDFQDRGDGVQIYGDHVHFVGIEVANSTAKGINPTRANQVVIENCDVHDCTNWGIMANGGDGVVFRNCDSHHNDGEPENSDGFNMTSGGGEPATNGLIEGCRSWANGDDGYDMWVSNGHTIRDCWAWDNGRGSNGDGNGFKLGGQNRGGGHTVVRCVAYDNRHRGFDWNTGGDPIEVYNCTAIGNDINYRFRENGDTLVNNISYEGSVQIGADTTEEANSWNHGMGAPQFSSTDPDSGDFLRLQESSPCRNAGIDVGLSYRGDAPDLGAFEFQGDTGSPDDRLAVDGEVTLAASDAVTNADSHVESEHPGYTSEGYINLEPDSGAYARWELDVSTGGTYDYQIRYANGGEIDRTAVMTAGEVRQDVTFPQTDAWPNYGTVTGSVDLAGGALDLVVQTVGEDSGNIDHIALVPQEDDDEDDSGSDPGRGEPTGDTDNHGYNTPDAGTADWHVPLNENFEQIDRDVPIVDADGVKDQYTPAERTLYIAVDTGTIYVGDGSQWSELGSLD